MRTIVLCAQDDGRHRSPLANSDVGALPLESAADSEIGDKLRLDERAAAPVAWWLVVPALAVQGGDDHKLRSQSRLKVVLVVCDWANATPATPDNVAGT